MEPVADAGRSPRFMSSCQRLARRNRKPHRMLMHQRVWKMLCLSVVLLGFGLAGGCNWSSTPEKPVADVEENDPQTARPQDEQRGLKVRPNVKAFPGRWGLVTTQALPGPNGGPAFRDLCLSLIEFQDAMGTITGTVIASLPNVPESSISDVEVDGDRVRFNFVWGEQKGDFEGVLKDGVARGALRLGDAGVLAAMLRPTEETTFEGWDPAPLAAGREILNQAAVQKEQPAALLQAAREIRGTGLSLQAYERILSNLAAVPDLDAAMIKSILAEAVEASSMWGPLVVDRTRYTAAIGITRARKFPELVVSVLDELEKSDMKGLQPDQRESLAMLREQAQVDEALTEITSKDAEVQKNAFEKLQAFLPKQRFNPELLFALGKYASEHEQVDQAIEYLADVVSLPLLETMLKEMRSGEPPGDPTARELLLNLWEAREGSVDGFEEMLSANYELRLDGLKSQVLADAAAVVPQEDRKRLPLVELMTGAMCPPCVAADIAGTMIQQTYPDDVIVLKYHQHIPGPDPLATPDGEERFAYYEGRGTPSFWINGMVPPPDAPLGGQLDNVEGAYESLRGMIDHQVKEAATATLQLSAEVKDGILNVKASATDFPEDQQSNLRLRLALVDQQIDLTTPNGIRTHSNVVREMLGGAKGTGVRNGKLEYSIQMPLSDVEEHLNEYLRQFEVGRNLEFVVKPTKPGALLLVGWVQNESNHLILAADRVPVIGTGSLKPAATPSTPTTTDSPQSPASAVDAINTPATPASATPASDKTPEKAPEKAADKESEAKPEPASEKAPEPKPEAKSEAEPSSDKANEQ